MKPFFGIDLTTDKKNEQINGAEFLVMKPSAAMTQAFARSSQRAEETIAQSKLPLPLRIIQAVCGLLGMTAVAGLLRGLGNVSLEQAYENASWVFWIAGGCLIIWGLLKLLSKHKEKSVLSTDESTHTLANLESMCNAVFTEMSVPEKAREADLLSFHYKIKNGHIKPCEKGSQVATYFNPIVRVFADSENLYIANLEGKYAFPLSSLVAIHTVKKHIRIAGWNKNKSFHEGIYKQYKLTTDNMGCLHCKYYHIIEINHNGTAHGIYIPCYELPVFEKLTGLKAKTE